MNQLTRKPRRFVSATLVLGTALAALTGCPAPPKEEIKNVAERAATRAKPAVVQIYSGCTGTLSIDEYRVQGVNVASGTGFFIHSDGYVMTNAHVVRRTKIGDDACAVEIVENMARELASQSSRSAQEWYDALKVNGVRDFQRVAGVILQSGKVLPFEIKEYGAPVGDGKDMQIGKDVAVLKIEVKNAPTLEMIDSEKTRVGDKVWIIGYPGKAYIAGLLDQKSERQPMTTGGAVTSTMATTDGAPLIGTDAAASHGNSGGPAVDEKGRVMGLLTLGPESDAFNYLVASNTAKEFIPNGANRDQKNRVDELWDSGLAHYWAGEYGAAKKDFKRVVELYPDHSEATRLIDDINDNHGEEAEEPAVDTGSVARWVGVGFACLVGLVSLVAAIALLTRKKPARPLAPMPHPQQHVAGYPYPPAPTAAGYPALPAPAAAPTMHLAGYPYPPAPVPSQPVAPPVGIGSGGYPVAPASPRTAMSAAGSKTMAYAGPIGGGSARLTCTAGPLKGREFPIGLGLVIGRDPARAHIVIDDAAVSGAHVWIGPRDGRFVVQDCGSLNGTFLNERYHQRVEQAHLGTGDVLTVGQGTATFALVA
jgi:serine protease Do